MKKIGAEIRYAVEELSSGSDSARLNLRVQQVRDRYRQVIEAVYRESAPLHLAHTNNVIISKNGDVKTLVVYVDDSLFAAELNAQRELIRLKLLELFEEEIDDFQIRTSQWRKYRENHPYATEGRTAPVSNLTDVTLDDHEMSLVSDAASHVSDKKVRKSFEKAMTADLQWKKGEKVESVSKSENRTL